jgi:hypothetical protein
VDNQIGDGGDDDVLDDREARDRHLARARALGETYFGTVGVTA